MIRILMIITNEVIPIIEIGIVYCLVVFGLLRCNNENLTLLFNFKEVKRTAATVVAPLEVTASHK